MEAIFSDMEDGVLVLDRNQAVLYVNPAASRMLAMPRGDLVGQPLPFSLPACERGTIEVPARGNRLALRRSAVTWQARSAHLITLREVAGREQVGEPCRPRVARDCSDPSCTPGEVRSLNAQLEALLQREQKARADVENQRALLQGVLDKLPAMMCILRGPEHVYEYVNETYCKVFGSPPAHFLGRRLRDVFPEMAEQGMFAALDDVFRSGGSSRDMDLRFAVDVNQDGVPEVLYFAPVRQAIRDAGGQVTGILIHAIEVTDSVEARQAVEQKNEEIARLNRELEQRVIERTAQLQTANAELEAFAYSVSHDLRAPLRRIDGFGQALLEDYEDRLDEVGQHYLARIRYASQHMGELIDDLLTLSRISRLDIRARAVDLSAMARQILDEFREQAPARQVAVTIAPDMHVLGDESFLWIALENLLGNAWKFTGKTERAAIEVGSMERDGERVFFVRDNGAGFDPRYKAKLFQTFNRLHTPAQFPGTGIGLGTVKRVIDRHGGRIWAEGAIGRGAVFYFTLPEG